MSAETTSGVGGRLSLWRRLRFTPMRDVIRGRISGRLDVESVISAEKLPADLTDIVRTVVRRARLWPLERVDLARELCAHFQDGLESGTSQENLAASFGDPCQAARLIRRAKLRNRSLGWKTMRLARRACAVLFAIYIVLFIRVQAGEPTISRDFVAELNAASLAMPAEDRAWPIYREASSLAEKSPGHDVKLLRPGTSEWEELAAYVARNGEAIALYRTAASMPRLGRIIGQADDLDSKPQETGETETGNPTPLLSVLLPELTVLRSASRLLVVDAYIAGEAGDAARVMSDLDAVFGICEHVAEMPFLVSDLTAISVVAMQSDAIRRLLHEHSDLFTADQLQHLSHRLAGVRGGGPLRARISLEGWFFEDIIQRIYTDDGEGAGHLTPKGRELMMGLSSGGNPPLAQHAFYGGFSGSILLPVADLVVADRREMMRKHDELTALAEAEARKPLWERDESAADQALEALQESWRDWVRYMPVAILTPSLSRASVLAELTTLKRDATCAVLGCELFRQHEGRWPNTLAELTPLYLPVPPIDRFDGEPLRYRLGEGKPVLYSIGGNYKDDGGLVPESPNDRRAIQNWRSPGNRDLPRGAGDEPLVGDWVFWPPAD